MGSFTTDLRRLLCTSGLTVYRIAKDSGVPESSIGRFLRGKHGLTIDSLDKIAPVLGLRLVSEGAKSVKAAKAKRKP